jgi:CPA2 family monovalent cation:H+ antiporter-2
VLSLGALGALALRAGVSPIPLYLIAGLAFGTGGIMPLATSEEFISVGAELGVILLLLTLGLEYSADELVTSLKGNTRAGFAAVFFVFFGLQTDLTKLGSVAGPAILLAVVSMITKLFTGTYAAQRAGIARAGRMRAGTALISRGEFNIVIAGLAVASGVHPDLGPLAAAYVLILAAFGPLAARLVQPLITALAKRA